MRNGGVSDMREILFRGQTRRFGEKVKNFAGDPMPSNWVYGGVCCGEGAFSIIYAYMDEEKEIPIEKHVVYTDTIGQYTGLTDKNGKRIFEGDIVRADDYIFSVKYGKCGGTQNAENYGYMGFYLEAVSEGTKLCAKYGLRDDMCYFTDIKVIGNIHDNPELF
jgi:uncharacterized phage protein (TIGR01671 family)